jgi:alginate O-acetyltransferase complex protein AlgI
MLFHTSTFLIFFVLFLVCYLPVREKRAGIWVILVFSNVFYGWWSWKFLILLWATIVVDYTIARMLASHESPRVRKLLVSASLLTNLGLLAFFKYFNFFLSTASDMGMASALQWRIPDLVLPVGISFYVFQSLSYAIDVYRRKEMPVRNFIDYATFVCFFPQLVAGPINRLAQLMPQIVRRAPVTPGRVTSGSLLFAVGFFRKAVADNFATFVDPTFSNLAAATPVDVIMAVLGFGLQIYLDFTGYVDMARGVARIIGVELMVNFDAPYTSTSPREFWRRWHISLSQWLRDYLYISLGGNRYGMPRHLANLMITMLLGGLWHGAGLNYIIWGGLHGLYLVANTLWDRALPGSRGAPAAARLARGSWVRHAAGATLGWLLTWLAVNYAWLYFRIPTFSEAMIANRKIGEWLLDPTLPHLVPGLVLLVVIVVAMEIMIRLRDRLPRLDALELTLPRAAAQGVIASGLMLAGIVLLAGIATQQFIYFQF